LKKKRGTERVKEGTEKGWNNGGDGEEKTDRGGGREEKDSSYYDPGFLQHGNEKMGQEHKWEFGKGRVVGGNQPEERSRGGCLVAFTSYIMWG